MLTTQKSVWLLLGLLGLLLALPAARVGAADEEAISEKVKALSDVTLSPRDRSQIAEELGKYGPAALAAAPALIDALADEDSSVRASVSYVLTKIGRPTVPLLIAALDRDDVDFTARVLNVLEDIGPAAKDAGPRLLRALRSESGEVRAHAARALGAVRESAAVPALATLVSEDPDFGVRRNAAYALEDLGPEAKEAVPALIDAHRQAVALCKEKPRRRVSNSGPPPTRSGLLSGARDTILHLQLASGRALSAIGEPAVPGVVELLSDRDADLRVAGVNILANMRKGARPAVPDVAKCLQDQEPSVREYAARALGDIGRDAPGAIPALRKAFKDPVARVRFASAGAALSLDPKADGALEVLLEGTRDKESLSRVWAVQELGGLSLGTRAAAEGLAAALGKDADPDVREWAVQSLARNGGPQEVVVPALTAALQDGSSVVRCKAAQYLTKVEGGEKAVPALARALGDSSAGVRQLAARALRFHAAHAAVAIPALEAALMDPDDRVREDVADALKRIKEQAKVE